MDGWLSERQIQRERESGVKGRGGGERGKGGYVPDFTSS